MRGRIMGLTLIITVALLWAFPFEAPAQKAIKIGFAHVFSGGMATFGQVAMQGADLAVKEINQAGGILGRQVELVKGDTAAKPDIAKKAVGDLVNKDKVDIVIGIVSSAVAKAVTPSMIDLRCPLIITHAMADEVTGSLCNPWTFRMTWNLGQCYKGASLVAKDLGAKKWTTVGPDYGFGQESWQFFRKYLMEWGTSSFDEGIFTPISTKDWRPVIERIKKSGADGLMLSLWGQNLQDFIKQAKEGGLFQGRKVICPVGGSVEIFVGLGFLNMPTGIWFGSPYWFEAYVNDANKRFVNSYQDLSGARIPPSYAAFNSYAAVKMFKAAVEKAGSTDRSAVAKSLSGLTATDVPVGSITFRKEDHQALFKVVFGATGAHGAGAYKRMRGLESFRIFTAPEVTPPAAESKCQMKDL